MAGYQNGKLPTEAGRPKHSFNNIHVLTCREKDRNNQTRCKVQVQVQVQHFTVNMECEQHVKRD